MNGYNSGTEPCWMPLMELIETCLFDIIHTEDTTGRFIRLYGVCMEQVTIGTHSKNPPTN